MTRIAIAVLAAVTLMQSALSVAGNNSTDSSPKPSSFVPHPHTTPTSTVHRFSRLSRAILRLLITGTR